MEQSIHLTLDEKIRLTTPKTLLTVQGYRYRFFPA
jgi:hypothetical protein